MKIRSFLLTSAATSAIALAALTVPPVVQPGAFETHAATNVSINIGIGTFYDRLAPHGDWVSYRERYVWVPHHIDTGWRPYTVGHWVYTKRHGWLWVSDEPFGWAVYHYGRWGYARDIGWYWVPGRRWAPAWVAWHRTDRDVAWAPLPPDWEGGDDVEVFYSRAPAHYWQVVPVNLFLSVNIYDHVIRDRDRVRRVIREGRPEVVRIENNIVVNNVIDVDFIEQHTNKKVVVHEVKPAEDPEAAGKADEGTVAVFDPEVKEEAEAKPAKTKKLEEVKKERAALAPEDAEELPVEESAAPAEEQPAADGQQPVKKKEAATEAEATGEAPEAVETQATKEPIKKEAATEAEATGEAPEATETQATEEQPVKKKKAATEAEAAGEAPEATETQATEEPPVKKKKAATGAEVTGEAPEAVEAQPSEEPVTEQAPKAAEGQQKACDPNTQDCPQAN